MIYIILLLIIILIIKILHYNSNTPKIGDYYIETNSNLPYVVKVIGYENSVVIITYANNPTATMTRSRSLFLSMYTRIKKEKIENFI